MRRVLSYSLRSPGGLFVHSMPPFLPKNGTQGGYTVYIRTVHREAYTGRHIQGVYHLHREAYNLVYTTLRYTPLGGFREPLETVIHC